MVHISAHKILSTNNNSSSKYKTYAIQAYQPRLIDYLQLFVASTAQVIGGD